MGVFNSNNDITAPSFNGVPLTNTGSPTQLLNGAGSLVDPYSILSNTPDIIRLGSGSNFDYSADEAGFLSALAAIKPPPGKGGDFTATQIVLYGNVLVEAGTEITLTSDVSIIGATEQYSNSGEGTSSTATYSLSFERDINLNGYLLHVSNLIFNPEVSKIHGGTIFAKDLHVDSQSGTGVLESIDAKFENCLVDQLNFRLTGDGMTVLFDSDCVIKLGSSTHLFTTLTPAATNHNFTARFFGNPRIVLGSSSSLIDPALSASSFNTFNLITDGILNIQDVGDTFNNGVISTISDNIFYHDVFSNNLIRLKSGVKYLVNGEAGTIPNTSVDLSGNQPTNTPVANGMEWDSTTKAIVTFNYGLSQSGFGTTQEARIGSIKILIHGNSTSAVFIYDDNAEIDGTDNTTTTHVVFDVDVNTNKCRLLYKTLVADTAPEVIFTDIKYVTF